MRAGWWIIRLVMSSLAVLVIVGCDEQAAATGKMGSLDIAQETNEAVSPEPTDKTTAQVNSSRQNAEPKPAEALPKIAFDHVVHDFGNIAPKSRNKCVFKFTNEGSGVLKVKKKIGSTCGCTVPRLSKEEYQPGESGTIKVTYNAGSRAGKSSKRLYAYSNDKENSKVTLTIKADIIEKVSVKPTRLNLALNKENAGCPEITVTSKDGKEFSITRVTASDGAITAQYDPSVKATVSVLKPKVDIDKIKGRRNGILTIYLTHPDMDKITIPYTVLAPFKADPATIIALNAEPGQTIRRTVYILSNYNEPFEVESVKAGDDFVKIAGVEKHDKNRYKIDFDIVPPEQSKRRHFNSKVTVNIAGGQTLKINVIGAIAKQKK